MVTTPSSEKLYIYIYICAVHIRAYLYTCIYIYMFMCEKYVCVNTCVHGGVFLHAFAYHTLVRPYIRDVGHGLSAPEAGYTASAATLSCNAATLTPASRLICEPTCLSISLAMYRDICICIYIYVYVYTYVYRDVDM